MTQLRPLTILLAGPIGVGVGAAIPFWFFDPEGMIVAALITVVISLPLFGALAWAVALTRYPWNVESIISKYRRLNRWLSIGGIMALSYITGCYFLHLDQLLASVGSGLLCIAWLIVMLMAFGKIVVDQRLRRLHDLSQ
jgi:hypothetical protein